MTFKENIISLISENKRGYTERELCKTLNLYSREEKRVLSDALKELLKEDVLVFSDGRFLPFKNATLKGKLKCFEKGFAFFIPDDGSPDLFVAPKNLGCAFQGDTVSVRRVPGTEDEAEVVKVMERGVSVLTGEFFDELGFAFVRPDDKGFGCDVFVEKKNAGQARTGDKVVCAITDYPQGRNPEGKITEVLGKPRDLECEIKAALVNSGAPLVFPADVTAEAERLNADIPLKERTERTDFCNLLTVTIDGDFAKDFDDAVSIEKTPQGYSLYVHIADVSHYVIKGGAIDKEAYLRGTSIYLPEQVIPMLPERLSNGLCSLNPGEDRLTLTAKLDYDFNGNLTDKSFYKSIIRSDYRLTYKKVQAFFDGKDDLHEYENARELLSLARVLKDALIARRREKGSVDLETSEAEVYFENGQLLVGAREGLESEKVIEEFMIAANVAVAEYIYYMEIPLVYRVHEKPSEEKLQAFSVFLNKIGINANLHAENCKPKDFQKLLDSLVGSPVFGVVNNLMLRAMQKAKYSIANAGHFGLNEQCYCHFTSPIRRYPDLTVHRVLKAVIDGNIPENSSELSKNLGEAAKNSSLCELRADALERAADNIYICKFMSQFIGDFFEGIISGVTAFGVFIRLANSAEGIIRLENLPEDKYAFDEASYTLAGRKYFFTLGKTVLAKLISADISTGKIAFSFAAFNKDEKTVMRKGNGRGGKEDGKRGGNRKNSRGGKDDGKRGGNRKNSRGDKSADSRGGRSEKRASSRVGEIEHSRGSRAVGKRGKKSNLEIKSSKALRNNANRDKI